MIDGGVKILIYSVTSYIELLDLLGSFPYTPISVVMHANQNGIFLGDSYVLWKQFGRDLSSVKLSKYPTQIVSCYSSEIIKYLSTQTADKVVGFWPDIVDTELAAVYTGLWATHLLGKLNTFTNLFRKLINLLPLFLTPRDTLAQRLVLEELYSRNYNSIYTWWYDINPHEITPTLHIMNVIFGALVDAVNDEILDVHSTQLEIALALPHLIQGLWDTAEASLFLYLNGVLSNDDNDIYVYSFDFAISFWKIQEKVGWWWITIGDSFTLDIYTRIRIRTPSRNVYATIESELTHISTLYILPIFSHLNMDWVSGHQYL